MNKPTGINQKFIFLKLFFIFFFIQMVVLAWMPVASAQVTVPAGGNIPSYLTSGNNYNLILGGNANWNNAFDATLASSPNITIDGNNKTILVAPDIYMFSSIGQNNGTISLKNANVTTNPSISTTHLPLFYYGYTVTSNLNLEGSTFTGFGGTGTAFDGKWANIIFVNAVGANVKVDGGAAGVTFSNNRGSGDTSGAVALYQGNLTFNGKVTFDSNSTGDYGGAVSVYDLNNLLTFNGATTFTKNHSVVFGGALDLWGGLSSGVVFNGATTFDGNYVSYRDTISTEFPGHVTDQDPRGGAINVGYVAGLPGTALTFSAPVSFTNNYVVSNHATKNAYGGAISVYGNNLPDTAYKLNFTDSALFQGNYVVTTGSGAGNGGAIYYNATGSILNLASGTQFLGNYAKTLGGAIYLQSGTVNLNALTADITFQGNKQGVSFDASYKPIITTGTPNAIYLGSSGNLNLVTSAGQTIRFYDPIASIAGSTVTVTKSGSGEAIFYGNNGASSAYDSNIQANTSVQGGYFTLANGVKYGSTTAGTFNTQAGGTTRGSNGAEVRALSFSVASGGTLGVTGGTFTINSPTITLNGGSTLTGNGTLAATSNIILNGGVVTADIAASDTLNVTRLMSSTGGITKNSAGTLTLSAANTYTGATTVNAGTLSAGIANAFATSNAVTVNTGSTLSLNTYNQTANNLSGGGTISLGSAVLTAVNNANGTLSGTITGTGGLTKTGAGTTTLSGTNTYSGGTTFAQGNLVATNGSAFGIGSVNITGTGTLNLAFAADSTLANRLNDVAQNGTVIKTGAGVATLSNATSSVGIMDVQTGTLNLAQNGSFSAKTYTTENGATTTLGSTSKLGVTGVFTQVGGSTLNVAIGSTNNPAITAATANIAGDLNITGLITTQPLNASDLNTNQFNVISTTGGISGNFSSVNFGSSGSLVDYLAIHGGKSADNLRYSVGLGLAWYAGQQYGKGDFTLTNLADAFNVDVILANQTGPFTSTWNGSDLTKKGAGNLTLSAVNTYTGATNVTAGTLSTGVVNAFAQSNAVTVDSGATLALNNNNQIARNLSGGGALVLGSATLTANNSVDTGFGGNITGTGALIKTGTGTLTLSGINTYSSGTTISQGRLIASSSAALGSGFISTIGTLELAFGANGTIANQLTGTGTIEKTGTNTVTLSNTASSVGVMDVKAGTLALAQGGTFTAGTYTTENGATTSIGSTSKLAVSGAFTQASGSTLTVGIGGTNSPAVTAGSADITGSTLNVSGVNATRPLTASGLAANQFTVLSTSTGITGDFGSVNLGSASTWDYLTLAGRKSADNLSYSVGMGLTWLAGSIKGNGIFTLGTGETFNVDVALASQTGSATGWNGSDLTKNGAGNLTLSAVNTYTGATTINGGTLTGGATNAFAQSNAVTVGLGATLALGGYNQTAQNLSGGGALVLGSATLTASNSGNTAFSGVISGSGALSKTGAGTLTLSGNNAYSGGTSISQGRLITTGTSALGSGLISNSSTLELALAANGTIGNQLSGAGLVEKTGTSTVTLNNTASSVGVMDVKAGTLALAQAGTFTAGAYTTENGATTNIGSTAKLAVTNAFTQATGSTLTVGIGGTNSPAVTAGSANITGSTLNVSGVNATRPLTASGLAANQFTVLSTSTGITGDFGSVNLGSASTWDYLTLAGRKSADNLSYSVGMGLTWLAGSTKGNGIFTLGTGETFNVDVALTNQTGPFTSTWNGSDLTKEGAGNLTLSGANTYTGATIINGGTLTGGTTNAFASSSAVTVGSGATLALNGGYAQTAQNLSGAGSISLGAAALTASNNSNTSFGGVISGAGTVNKTGTGNLTLSGANTYSGGTTITNGSLIAKSGSSLGSGVVHTNAGILDLAFAASGTLTNQLIGLGTVEKTGTSTVTLNNTASSVGVMDVKAGTLALAQAGTFTAGTYTTENGATTSIGSTAKLAVTNAFTQATGSTLTVGIGGTNSPAVTANSANITGSTLNVSGINTSQTLKASDLTGKQFTVLSTTTGITGDFSSFSFGAAASPTDYLTLAGRKSADTLNYSVGLGLTWLAGTQNGNGVFTLTNAADTFNVDVILANQTGPFTSTWNGADLTKEGAGNLTLSGANTYTGATIINGGTLTTGINNAFANSNSVFVGSGATLALAGHNQTAQNLSGVGTISLGTAALTASNSGNTAFGGVISGTGTVNKTGAGNLTLSGTNTYAGGTSISQGRLITTGSASLGVGTVSANGGTLELAFVANGALANRLNGTGTIEKTGTNTVTLSNTASSVGVMDVKAGTLALAQAGTFTAGTYTTENGATTSIGSTSKLAVSGAFTQASGSTLTVGIGGTNSPAVTAGSADITGSTLNVSGVNATRPLTASGLAANQFTVLSTTTGITGDFSSFSFGAAASPTDYLTLAGRKSADNLSYSVGMGLTWLAGSTKGNGIFTLGTGETFNVDVILANQTGPFTSTWNGLDLTKNGAGNLTLSAVNTYIGATTINGGTLTAGIANAFAQSNAVTVDSGATIALNNNNQMAQNLSGSGTISLGTAALTASNTGATTFSGAISGAGSLNKTGTGALTLSGASAYGGGTTISQGRLITTGSNSLGVGTVSANGGTLELALAANGTIGNQLIGTGLIEKTGSSTVTLSNTASSVGVMDVKAGTLALAQAGTFTAGTYTTENGATTSIGSTAKLAVTNVFTQASGSTLTVGIGGTNSPVVTANSANITGSTLNVSGVNTSQTLKASDLAGKQYTILQTTGGTIAGDFSSIIFGSATSPANYLTLAGRKSDDQRTYSVGMGLTWLADSSIASGTFNLANTADTFNVDVVLATQGVASGWDGNSLTKAGAGNLTLSAVNTYTGATTINGGTLTTGINNAFANSNSVVVGPGATLALGGYAQTAQNLSGSGTISLGTAALTASNSSNTSFSGNIVGTTGALTKDGAGALTLSGTNTYSGGTTITNGSLITTSGSSLGSGAITNNATLGLSFIADGTLANSLSGTGTIEKTGATTVTLTNTTSDVGTMNVNAGTLALAQNGTFKAGTYTTGAVATTAIGTASKLDVNGVFTQDDTATLNVGIGINNSPAITAGSAVLGGTLTVSGINTTNPLKASDVHGKQFTLLETATGITDDFSSINFGGASSPAQYLVLAGWKSDDLKTYSVGMGLAWLADSSTASGTFNLANTADTFNVDVVLATQGVASGWDGNSLTKAGAGNLTLSAVNTYTGATIINGGTLTTGINNAFANSNSVVVGPGATLALGGFAQTANNLSGSGTISLGNAVLTASNNSATTFSGDITGTGSVTKTGTGKLTLSGDSTYIGGTTISDGTLAAASGTALGKGTVANSGTLELAFASDDTLANQLTGSGAIEKTGSGIATLTGTNSSVGNMDVKAGTLFLDQDGVFSAANYITQTTAATTIGTGATLDVTGNFTKVASSTLNVMIGNNLPKITAGTADLGGVLTISGFDITLPASVLTATRHTILHTNTVGGITGNFSSVSFGGVTTGVDYLLLDGKKDATNTDYSVGFELTWTSGATTGNGIFTLQDEANIFNVDVALGDKAVSATGWNGKDLTKNGEGTLILSATNTYSGVTTVDGGTLSLEANTALGKTSELNIGNGATVALNNTEQTVGKLNTQTGSKLNFSGGILTITDAQRAGGDTSGGSIQADTLFGSGGLVIDPSIVTVVGANTSYTGDVTVEGGSQLIMNDGAGVGNTGIINLAGSSDLLTFETLSSVLATGTLGKMLAGVGKVQTLTDADITLAGNNGAFSGTFDVGAASTLRASATAHLGSAEMTLDGTFIASSAANSSWRMLNKVTGTGTFEKDGAGQLLIYDNLSGFTGDTNITAGALVVGDANVTGATLGSLNVNVAAAGTLSGTGIITGDVVNEGTIASLNSLAGRAGAPASTLTMAGSLNNSGTINLAGGTAGNRLVVQGGMTSNNGTLILNTVAGGDDSVTDRLVLDGGTISGPTNLVVQNQGGRGGQTTTGILLVDAINGATTHSGDFVLSSLSSGYRSTTGTLAIGGFEYSLLQGGVGGQANNWYLSSFMENVRPEAGIYLVNRESAENMFLHTMHDRAGGYGLVIDPLTGQKNYSPVWARFYGNKDTTYAAQDTLRTKTDTVAFQAGLDLFGWSDPSKGALRTGVMLGKGTANSDTTSLWDSNFKASGDADGHALGVYATWFQDEHRSEGLYVDTWLQHAWFKNKTSGDGLPTEKYNSKLWAASFESGYSFAVNPGEKTAWFVEPSFQATYLKYSADDFAEQGGSVIHQGTNNKLTTRLGGRVYGRFTTDAGTPMEPFFGANWLHTNRKSSVAMDTNVVYSDRPTNIGEVKLGLNSKIKKDVSMNFDVSTQFGNHHYRQVGGQIAVRYQW